jgi:hypothetical protein
MKRNQIFPWVVVGLLLTPVNRVEAQEPQNTRQEWLGYLDRVSRPVLFNLANDELKEKMPVTVAVTNKGGEHGKEVAYLEAFARTLSGIAPWLNGEGGSPEEIVLRNQYREWALKGISNAIDPAANDYLKWSGFQPLVDASFFALALVRCPWLWENCDADTRQKIVTALQSSRPTIPEYSNWLLFSGMIEAFFCKYDLPYDAVRIEYGLREFFHHWYIGDGMFSDGPDYVLDYYNSYVIQPYLLQILEATREKEDFYDTCMPQLNKISVRYAELQERTINIDGTFPAFGRSIVYRGGAFQHLADMALHQKLPESLSPEQVRCALTSVIRRTLDPETTFTEDGWLNIGLSGHQPGIADYYSNTGSLYLCTAIFLPLGLDPDDSFWSKPDAPWTAQKIWNGMDVTPDHSLTNGH